MTLPLPPLLPKPPSPPKPLLPLLAPLPPPALSSPPLPMSTLGVRGERVRPARLGLPATRGHLRNKNRQRCRGAVETGT